MKKENRKWKSFLFPLFTLFSQQNFECYYTYLALLGRCFSWIEERALEGADGIDEDDLGCGINEWGIPLTPPGPEEDAAPPAIAAEDGLVDLELLPDAVSFTPFKLPVQQNNSNQKNIVIITIK